MDKQRFLDQREPAWDRYQRLCRRIEKQSPRSLDPDEIAEFSELYRELAGDLAIVQSRQWGTRLTAYLNELVARGYNAFYRTRPNRLNELVQFIAVGFPRKLRQNWIYFAVAAAAFFLPFLIAATVIAIEPAFASRIVPGEQLAESVAMYDHDPDAPGRPGITEERAAMGGFYVRNNVGIALRSFAGGIFLGTVTIYVLLANGISIGVISGYLFALGHGEAFASFVISHGSFELTALAIAGGAGLILGNAIIHPGDQSRRDALLSRGRDAVQIAAGAAIMLMIAAVIEAFWSPSNLPSIIKFVVGTALWILVGSYLALAGRGHDDG